MTLNKTKGFAVSLVSLGLLAAGMSAPIASATTVTSSVDAVDNCVWQLGAVPTSWKLTNANNFIGDELTLSNDSTEHVVFGLAGSTEADNAVSIGSLSSSECSFYNSITYSTVTAQLQGAALFTATYGDSDTTDATMNIDLSDQPLTASGAADDECNNTYFDAAFASTDFATLNQTATIMSSQTLTNIMPGGQGADGTDKDYKATCRQEIELQIAVPSRDSVPVGDGEIYRFSGPTFLFTLAG
jgi:hypothetical protein